MLQITPGQVTPELRSMFKLDRPTGIRAFAVLAGGNAGRIFTDDIVQPHWCLVWEADDGTLYPSGSYSQSVLSTAVALLRQNGTVAIGFREGDPVAEFLPPDPQAGADCLEFERPIGNSDLSPYLYGLPEGFSIQRMDRVLLERSPKADENLNRYGSIENYLDRGIAVCVLQGDEIVCEAYADMEIMGIREIGIRTQEAFRKRGFATMACSHLINLCEKLGSMTYWDCAKLNAGSVALARKLGFRNERAYKLLAWFGQ